jgi:hypothetical protein
MSITQMIAIVKPTPVLQKISGLVGWLASGIAQRKPTTGKRA